MDIIAKIDPDQTYRDRSEGLAVCPHCGQKLFEVMSLQKNGVFRHKCRRCKKYIQVSVIGNKQ